MIGNISNDCTIKNDAITWFIKSMKNKTLNRLDECMSYFWCEWTNGCHAGCFASVIVEDNGTGDGAFGFRSNFNPSSSFLRLALKEFNPFSHHTIFSNVFFPPWWRGITWSIFPCARVSFLPVYWHWKPSLRIMASLVGRWETIGILWKFGWIITLGALITFPPPVRIDSSFWSSRIGRVFQISQDTGVAYIISDQFTDPSGFSENSWSKPIAGGLCPSRPPIMAIIASLTDFGCKHCHAEFIHRTGWFRIFTMIWCCCLWWSQYNSDIIAQKTENLWDSRLRLGLLS